MISQFTRGSSQLPYYQKEMQKRYFRWEILSPNDPLEKGIEVVRQQKDFFSVPFLYDESSLKLKASKLMDIIEKQLNCKPTTSKERKIILKKLSPKKLKASELKDIIKKSLYYVCDPEEKKIILKNRLQKQLEKQKTKRTIFLKDPVEKIMEKVNYEIADFWFNLVKEVQNHNAANKE